MSTEAATLAQKIIDARLALARLRKTHPHPRLTIPLADQKLADQVMEMQTLNDEVQTLNKQTHALKEGIKKGSFELESLRMERAEVEKAAKQARVEEEDVRLVPLYNWFVYLFPSLGLPLMHCLLVQVYGVNASPPRHAKST